VDDQCGYGKRGRGEGKADSRKDASPQHIGHRSIHALRHMIDLASPFRQNRMNGQGKHTDRDQRHHPKADLIDNVAKQRRCRGEDNRQVKKG
jgi:hypothetical protein